MIEKYNLTSDKISTESVVGFDPVIKFISSFGLVDYLLAFLSIPQSNNDVSDLHYALSTVDASGHTGPQ